MARPALKLAGYPWDHITPLLTGEVVPEGIDLHPGFAHRPGYYAKLAFQPPAPVRIELFRYDNRANPEAVNEAVLERSLQGIRNGFELLQSKLRLSVTTTSFEFKWGCDNSKDEGAGIFGHPSRHWTCTRSGSTAESGNNKNNSCAFT